MTIASTAPMNWRDRILIILCLVAIPAVLFHESFKPAMVLFSNDGPLGIAAAEYYKFPEGFTGMWVDTTWLGTPMGAASPNFTFGMASLLGPIGIAKFLAPCFVIVLGLAAAWFFRVLGFRPMVCLLGGMAAELNSNFFSNACWGVGTRCSALAAAFLACAAIYSSQYGALRSGWIRWLKLMLAGFAVGMSVMEGADNGAIFSLFVAAFTFYLSLIEQGSMGRRILLGAIRIAVVAICALVISWHTVTSLVGMQIKGKVGMEQDTQTKKERWIGATLWSLPKAETLRVLIPGLYGYRMDTPDGGAYWGRVGEHPQAPGSRYSGAGEYAGVLVVLIAAWAVARSLSRNAKTFTPMEQKLIWFWMGAGIVAVPLGWGRFAPFYAVLYDFPMLSKLVQPIRNPMKFFHPAHMALMILFAYGLQGLAREYFEKASSVSKTAVGAAKGWRAKASSFERKWTYGCIGALLLAALGWFAYSATKSDLVRHMTTRRISIEDASQIARFSVAEVGIFVMVLGVCVGAVLMVQAGVFRGGTRSQLGGLVLGLILFADLARANAPWIIHYDYKAKYASNPLFDILKDRRWEHRVTMPPIQINQEFAFLQRLYQVEWVMHPFQFYSIQSVEAPQEGRMAVEKQMYVSHLGTNIVRYWQLLNARYVFGLSGGLVDMLNQQLDPVQKRFRVHTPFALYQKPGTQLIGVQTNTTGPFALIEFAGALPRARLYSQWTVNTNDTNTLMTLANPSFNPEQIVLVNDPISAAPIAAATVDAGKVEYVEYAPKRIEQRASVAVPSILLLNDRYDSDWHVTVDGKPAKLLRCNFIVRGVELLPGEHTVLWEYEPKLTSFYISLSAVILAVLLCGVLGYVNRRAPVQKKA